MSTTGTGGPPAGMMPPMDMSEASSLQNSIIAEWVIMFVLAAITVVARIYTRIGLLTGLKIEDWFVVAGLVLALGSTIGFIRRESHKKARGHLFRWTVSNSAQRLP